MLAIPTAFFTNRSGATVLIDPRVLMPEAIAHGRPRHLVILAATAPSCAVSAEIAASATRNRSNLVSEVIQDRTAAAIRMARILVDQVMEVLLHIAAAMRDGIGTGDGTIAETTHGQTIEVAQARVRSDLRRPSRVIRLALAVVARRRLHRNAMSVIQDTSLSAVPAGSPRLRRGQVADTTAVLMTTDGPSARENI